jgi:DNA-binding MarR family transcriptional regulator
MNPKQARDATAIGAAASVLQLEKWLPYRCSVIVNIVSLRLAQFYHSRFGLTVPAWRMMAALGRTSPLSALELARGAAMDQVSVTRAINQLAALGMVIRGTDPKDGRRVALRLSAKGRAAYEAVVPLAVDLEVKLVAGLTRREIDTLHQLIGRVQKTAAKLENGEGSPFAATSERTGPLVDRAGHRKIRRIRRSYLL